MTVDTTTPRNRSQEARDLYEKGELSVNEIAALVGLHSTSVRTAVRRMKRPGGMKPKVSHRQAIDRKKQEEGEYGMAQHGVTACLFCGKSWSGSFGVTSVRFRKHKCDRG
jgi:AraC-like DNA-binding protein